MNASIYLQEVAHGLDSDQIMYSLWRCHECWPSFLFFSPFFSFFFPRFLFRLSFSPHCLSILEFRSTIKVLFGLSFIVSVGPVGVVGEFEIK